MIQNQQLDRFKDTLVGILINERLDQYRANTTEDEALIEEAFTILEEEGIDIESLTEEQLEELFGGRVTNLLMGKGFKSNKQVDYEAMSPEQRKNAAMRRIKMKARGRAAKINPGETAQDRAYRNQQRPNKNRALRAAAARTKGVKFQEKPKAK